MSAPMHASASLRVVIVEDDRRYRSSLEQLFEHAGGFTLVASFASPLAALAEAARIGGSADGLPWDVVIMDLELPQMSGIEATRRLKAMAPPVRVVVLTVFEDPAAILEAICAGADGYLLKKARARELIEGLRAAAIGGSPLTSEVARKVLDLLRAQAPPLRLSSAPTRFTLTEREQDVLRALVEGLTYKQAANALGISLGTVRSHITEIYRKLQVHNVAEAVTHALRRGLI